MPLHGLGFCDQYSVFSILDPAPWVPGPYLQGTNVTFGRIHRFTLNLGNILKNIIRGLYFFIIVAPEPEIKVDLMVGKLS